MYLEDNIKKQTKQQIMSTHGVIFIRQGDFVFGFHMMGDGDCVIDFVKNMQQENITDPSAIFKACFVFCAATRYEDRSYIQIIYTPYRENEHYDNYAEYSAYYDGDWSYNWGEE